MEQYLLTYTLARELDIHFKSFDIMDFVNLVDVFATAGSEKNQRQVCDLFKRLPKEEVISRAAKISKLSRLLTTIKINRRHALSGA